MSFNFFSLNLSTTEFIISLVYHNNTKLNNPTIISLTILSPADSARNLFRIEREKLCERVDDSKTREQHSLN